MSPLKLSQKNHQIVLENKLFRVVFDTNRTVVPCFLGKPGGTNLLADPGGMGDLWKVTLVGPGGTKPEFSNQWGIFEGADITQGDDEGTVSLRWKILITNKTQGLVTVRIHLGENSSLSRWSLSLELPDGWKLLSLVFPQINQIQVEELDRAAVPTGWGVEYNLEEGLHYPGHFPSWEAVMQMVALYGKDSGLYIAAEDREAGVKNLSLDTLNGSTCFALESFPQVTGGKYDLPFEVAIGLYQGGWEEAARLYREFTLTTQWGNIPKVSGRSIPQWLQDTDLWLRPDGSAADNVEVTKEALEFFGSEGTSLHWYRWHEIPYDTFYPEYFPPLPGFGEGIKTLQESGSHVMPYINGRLWDPDSNSWQEKKAYDSAVRQRDGSLHSEIYGSLIPNNVMCPGTELWQNTVAEVVEEMFREYHTDGVYIDQICAARGLPCYAENHGHEPGDGGNWHRGYRKMMEEVRRRIPEGKILATEECAEPWLDLFDAHIILNTPITLNSIPLFAAVYSDRVIGYCSLYYAADEPGNALTFRRKNSRAFLYGSQLGWIQPNRIMAPECRAEAEFLRDLAATRRRARPFVTDGQLIKMLPVEGENEILCGKASGGFGPDHIVREPAVSASLWVAGNQVGVLVCNISDTNRTITIKLDEKNLTAPEKLTLIGSEGERETIALKSAIATFAINAAEAVVLKGKCENN